MDWIASNWEAIAGAAGGLYGAYQKWQRKREQKRTARELDAIRTEAGTKAPHELDLSEQARLARSKKKTERL